jgi:hypothetical protein
VQRRPAARRETRRRQRARTLALLTARHSEFTRLFGSIRPLEKEIRMRKPILFTLLLSTALPLAAQTPAPAPTPAPATAAPAFRIPRVSQKQVLTQTVGNTDVTLTYSRPGVKGRTVWGALVPYDQVWRTGANEATTIAFTDDVTINGQPLPKGTYSLHSIPTASGDWTLIFNKTANQWGSFTYDEKQDALRVKVKAQKSDFHEWMSIDVPTLSTDEATFVIRWENLGVPFTVATATTQKTLAAARAAVAAAKPDDVQTRARAAQFAYNSGLSSDEAMKWIDQAIAVKANINNLWLKAQMQAKAGDKAGARATAQKAISVATDKDKEEVEEIQKAMASWK